MPEIFTEAFLPGVFNSGFAERGTKTRDEMLKIMRAYATHQKETAEKILAATDDRWDVKIVRGVYKQTLIKQL